MLRERLLLLISLILISYSTESSEARYTDWMVIGNQGVSASLVYKNSNAVLFIDTLNKPNVGFTTKGGSLIETCPDFNDEIIYRDIILIDGEPIHMDYMCAAKATVISYPALIAGATYVINQFKKNKEVHVDYGDGYTDTYSAMNFTNTFNQLVGE